MATPVLMFILTTLVSLVSTITAVAVLSSGGSLPIWFPPVLLVGTLCFCGLLFLNLTVYKRPHLLQKFEFSFKNYEQVIWLLIWISFFAVSSLHQFYLLTPSRLVNDILNRENQFLWLFNTQLNLLGLIAVPLIYFFRKRYDPVVLLLILAGVLLIPNDTCRNSFNRIWLHYGVWSPMMYVPNIAVILFSVPLLRRPNLLSLGAIITLLGSTLFLGFGHIMGFLW